MIFGAVPLDQAEGAILAHSEPLPGGRLRKGKVLDSADLRALADAGHAKVTVARLEPGDMDEDTATLALARALVPDPAAANLSVQAVGTGRVNITAAAPGLVRIDADAIARLNTIDPAITVATVPPLHRMDAGGMVATVKIIAYGVAGTAVKAACATGAGALSLLRPTVTGAVLIETQVGAAPLGDKGRRVTAERLARLDVPLTDHILVAHDEVTLAQALGAAETGLILIITASATSDIRDTAPAALVRAGGWVEHFGMPVDPGNLLFLGTLGSTPVIGLPGCARSPALNGADWVLERIVCGVPVTAADIMAMGVGGLLKEIPSRPRPRQSAGPAD